MSEKTKLPRREREILDVLFEIGTEASAEEIRERLSDPPSYSAVRAMLRILEDKGHLRHVRDGVRHVYLPTVTRDRAQRTAAGVARDRAECVLVSRELAGGSNVEASG